MISKELLELLVCPEDRTPLEVADADLVARLNEAIDAGALKNRGGQPIEQRCDAALIRADGTLAYPVIDDIPVMLIDEAIPLAQLQGGRGKGD